MTLSLLRKYVFKNSSILIITPKSGQSGAVFQIIVLLTLILVNMVISKIYFNIKNVYFKKYLKIIPS